jgi:hypothetical protein
MIGLKIGRGAMEDGCWAFGTASVLRIEGEEERPSPKPCTFLRLTHAWLAITVVI